MRRPVVVGALDTEDAPDLLAEGGRIHSGASYGHRDRPFSSFDYYRGRRTGRCGGDKPINPLDQLRVLRGQAQQQPLQLAAIQPGEQLGERRAHRHRVGCGMDVGQQRRHDMFAQAAPIVGAATARRTHAASVEADRHPVGLIRTALDLGPQQVAAQHQRADRTTALVVHAAGERICAGVLADLGFAQRWQHHRGTFRKSAISFLQPGGTKESSFISTVSRH